MTSAEILNAPTRIASAGPIDVRRATRLESGLVEDEPKWRWKPPAVGAAPSQSRVIATRWRSLGQRTLEVSAQTPADGHIVGIALRNENVRFAVSGRMVHDGLVTPGAFHVTEPGAQARCVFRGPYDVVHLHV